MNKFEKFSQNYGKLSAEELKHVKGGTGGTCGFIRPGSTEGVNNPVVNCSVSKEYALSQVSQYGGNWCCESCGSSSYCGGGSNQA
jgi:hypothetical protein